jgi:hypothetical protein
VEQWKQSFVNKLNAAQSHWVKRFDEALAKVVTPTVEEFREFLASHAFKVFSPFRDDGRQSFKFELAENAYLLMIFRAVGVGEAELRTETFAPGNEPVMMRVMARLADVDASWTRDKIQQGLDTFVELLAHSPSGATAKPQTRERKQREPELVTV